YRFLRRKRAFVRYGKNGTEIYRGEPVRNSVCSRVFHGCRSRLCRLQSPNYPGIYPRNVTCYYLVKALPPTTQDLQPFVSLSQNNDRLIQVGHQGHHGRVSPESIVRQNFDCKSPEDFLLIYDGSSMTAPLLAKLCGTAKIPNISASGPDMLLVFQSAISGLMNHPPNLVSGFEVNVNVFFKEENPGHVKGPHCSHVIKSFGLTKGEVRSPIYSMPPNTLCSYHFQGRRHEVVWMWLTRYRRTMKKNVMKNYVPCRNRFAVYDGVQTDLRDDTPQLLGSFCEDRHPPICVRSRQKDSVSRPCSTEESFLSSNESMYVTQEFTDGTSLLPLNYEIHFEFVNMVQENRKPESDCDHIFISNQGARGHFSSPKNLFLYGRGGKTSLSCKYTFKPKVGEAVKMKIKNVAFRGNSCKTIHNFNTDLYECIARLPGSAVLEVWEKPWKHTRLPLGCLCSGGASPAIFESHTNHMQLDFVVKSMSWSEDFNDIYFEAEYEFVQAKNCLYNRELNGSTGIIHINGDNSKILCYDYPWKITARGDKHLYLNIPGYHASSQRCSKQNRIVIFSSHSFYPVQSICPEETETDSVQVLSSGWSLHTDLMDSSAESLIIRYLAREEQGSYLLSWLEIRREPHPSALESLKDFNKKSTLETCPYLCPGLDACINAELWCDGVRHCPSGADELWRACIYHKIPWFYVGLGIITLLTTILITSLILVAMKIYQR
ncbi:hypothetical protein SK128_021018, partial [Halocaridina rubra]